MKNKTIKCYLVHMQLNCKSIHEDDKCQLKDGGCLWGEKEVSGIGSDHVGYYDK